MMVNGVLNMLFRFNLFCGLAVLLFLLAGTSTAAGLPDTIDKIRGSVVAVGTITPIPHAAAKKPVAKYLGTGFVVGDGRHVITNYHVISNTPDSGKNETLAIFTGRGKAAQFRKATVLRSDSNHDLALLKFSGAPLPAVALGGKGKVREGTAVAFTGFPLGMTLGLYPVTHKSIVSAITPVVIPANSSGQLTAKQIQRLKSPFNVYQLDAVAYPGNSGSPVYDVTTGKVIGVLNSVFVKGTKEAVLKTPSGISYAIPTKYVKDLMSK
jgi:S1-C subfamily serine protease